MLSRGPRPPRDDRSRGGRTRARRNGFVAFALILVVLIVVAWVERPGTRIDDSVTAGVVRGPAVTGGEPAVRSSDTAGRFSLPAHVPIKHVVFMVKENRTFNEYFGTYPGAAGSAFGTSIRHGHHIQLKPCYDRQPHDITHGFSS